MNKQEALEYAACALTGTMMAGALGFWILML